MEVEAVTLYLELTSSRGTVAAAVETANEMVAGREAEHILHGREEGREVGRMFLAVDDDF